MTAGPRARRTVERKGIGVMAKRELDALAVSALCENLALLLGAGIQLDEAAGLLCEDSAAGPFREAARTMQKALLLGESLSSAVEKTGALPGYAVRMIAAGEKAGRTEPVLNSLARYYASQARLQKKLHSAVVYPAVLLGLMAAILAVLLAWVLPVFTGVYEGLVGDIATSSYGYIRLAYWVGGAALAVTLVLAVLVTAGAALSRTAAGRTRLSRVFQRLPYTAGASRRLAVARLAGALDIFIASGLDADTAMEAAEGMVDHAGLHAAISAARAQMAGGAGLGTAVHDQKLFEPLYARMLLSGERSGKTEQVLARLTSLFTQDADDELDRVVDMIEPALAAFLTVSVGVTLLSVMLPLIGILGTVG